MCPSPPLPPSDDISMYWTDEELFMSLDKMLHGSSLPRNVIDVNPCQYKPSDLPADVWYFIRSGMQKEAETGLWKAKDEASRIFMNPVITGWRTTYKYYEGQAPSERKTDWVMQEYRITKGMHENSRPKDARSLCRVFRSNVQSPSNEMQQNLASKQNVVDGESISLILSKLFGEENNGNGQGFPSRSDENSRNGETNTVPVTEGLFHHPVENLPEIDGDYLELLDLVNPASPSSNSRNGETNTVPVTEGLLNHPVENLPEIDGDYLELLDLVNPASPSSSSENLSCLFRTSDEYFGSLALLRDLESEDINDPQPSNADYNFSILASVRPNEVVMHLETAGSVTSGNRNKTPAEALKTDSSPPGSVTGKKSNDKTAVKPAFSAWKAENDIGGPSSKSRNVAASSSGHDAALGKEKEAVTGKKTNLKKYYRFMPF